MSISLSANNRIVLTIVVAVLGYFVDIFDLILFLLVRVQSLKDLQVAPADMLSTGTFLLNLQMAGLLVGGIFWGLLGDRKGRLSVLIGSIILYSIANLANAYVQSVSVYALLRFIAGVGLAGELGAGVTIVTELLPQKIRGLGSTIIAGIGVLGGVTAALVVDWVTWRHAYMLGGIIGLSLLALRLGVRESGLFAKLKQSNVIRGDLWRFIRQPRLLARVGVITLVGIPIWLVIGVLGAFTPELGHALGFVVNPPRVTQALMYLYLGLGVGSLWIGALSQLLQSRRRAVLSSLGLLALVLLAYPTVARISVTAYYVVYFALGCGAGYWAMLVQIAAEQFGTNYRATVTTSVPNLVRGSTILMTLTVKALIPHLGVVSAALCVGFVVLVIATLATLNLPETFNRNLDYEEVV